MTSSYKMTDNYDGDRGIYVDTRLRDRVLWYYDMLDVVKRRSSCRRKKTAALIINLENLHILSVGYNGSPPGMRHCDDKGCFMVDGHCSGTLHSELNAIANLEHIPRPMAILSLLEPCLQCTKTIIAFRFKLCIFRTHYEDPVRDSLLKMNLGKPRTVIVRIQEEVA